MALFKIVQDREVAEKLIYYVESPDLEQAVAFVRDYVISPHDRLEKVLEEASYAESGKIETKPADVKPYDLARHCGPRRK